MTHRCALSECKWTLAKSWCISELSGAIRRMTTLDAAIDGPELRLYGGPADDLELRYIPFDPLPAPDARVVLVGITPGQTQLRLAIAAARQALSRGLDDDEVIRRAKSAAAFGGATRANLIWMLDRVGLPGALGIASTGTVFAERGCAPRRHDFSGVSRRLRPRRELEWPAPDYPASFANTNVRRTCPGARTSLVVGCARHSARCGPSASCGTLCSGGSPRSHTRAHGHPAPLRCE